MSSLFSGRNTPEGISMQGFDANFEQKVADIYLPYLSAVYRWFPLLYCPLHLV